MSLIPFIMDLAEELQEFNRNLVTGSLMDVDDFELPLRRPKATPFYWMSSNSSNKHQRHHPYAIRSNVAAAGKPLSLSTTKPMEKDASEAAAKTAYSVVNKNGFQVSMNVKQFQPNELTVKTIENCIVVEGRHEDKEDGHGVISRHFIRKYMLPKGYDPNEVLSTLSSDGILTVKAPPPAPKVEHEAVERIVNIQETGAVLCSKEPIPQQQQQQQQQQQTSNGTASCREEQLLEEQENKEQQLEPQEQKANEQEENEPENQLVKKETENGNLNETVEVAVLALANEAKDLSDDATKISLVEDANANIKMTDAEENGISTLNALLDEPSEGIVNALDDLVEQQDSSAAVMENSNNTAAVKQADLCALGVDDNNEAENLVINSMPTTTENLMDSTEAELLLSKTQCENGDGAVTAAVAEVAN